MFHISTQLKVTIGFFALLLLIGLSVGLVYHEMSTSMENKQHEMAHIDSMRAKIMKKDLQIEEALQTVKTVYNPSDYEPYLDHLINTKDTLINKPRTEHKTVTTTQQYTMRQRKNLLKRIHDVFAPGKGDTLRVKSISTAKETDSVAKAYNPDDSVKKLLEGTRRQAEARHRQKIRQLNRQVRRLRSSEAEMARQTDQLMQIMKGENYLLQQQQIENMKSARRHSVKTLGWVAITALLLAGIFLFIIFRDIEKGNRYKHQLEQANEETSRLLAEREQLMLTVTHDIKAPAGSILGYADLMKRIIQDERQRTYLNNMKASAQHLLRMVTSLLDYHQLDAHKMKIQYLNFQPAELFDTIYQSFLPLASQKNIQIRYSCSNILRKTYRGDAFRIRQIVENLMSNALKFTDKGIISLAVGLSNSDLSFSVADTGPGMKPEEQQKIFNEFTRLPNAQGHEGFGLGLSITKKLVQLMQGEIWVTSEPGKGSTFHVTLPIQPEGPQMTVNSHPTHLTRLLLIDDDPLQLQLTKAMLAHQDIRLTTSLHPLEVIDQLKENDYDAIITDVQMPEMDGFQLVKEIREAGSILPVYALTARSDIQEEELRKFGFSGCLHKPFTTEELMSTITHQPAKNEIRNKNEFNFASLTAFAGDDEQAAQVIIQTFLSETRKNCHLITEALQHKDVPSLTATAHRMLPVFMQIGEERSITALSWIEKQRGQTFMTAELKENAEEVLAASERIMAEAQK
ncbi:MAG: hybrid sensor histidine kinase/response regulator [Prevotella sp.]|jgi:signal transduction histidine kinase/CheY-like chemotaxis protein|nr:hybrid sensor histidine kinase/response regulator [Prevotella sp.]MCH3991256.1 hybrid sensor histidine kinase/response regulator [Prevotella sp.]MCI1474046.1 hybrid sensor histidine kinase/response regulator [Prevotella sp.]MCI1518785.1 hybrid sensor histidine kinase/response regulator [Prevotella sp.]MCI1549513.1 hybrid sensor histidine kinase/response regulator [Prevotella sp.]MCI1595200.1 hybrid sensor histidine kinase/response regulator [Prevotella sp.]